jgi:hypothetical protein
VRSTNLRARGALALAGLLCLLLVGSAAAQSTASTPVKVDVRAHDIQTLPLYVGLRSTAAPLTVEITVSEVHQENPCENLGASAQAALTSALDLLRCTRPNVVDAFNFYRRAPVALVADVPADTADLSGLVVSHGTGTWLLGDVLADMVGARPGAPRLVSGGEGWTAIAPYRAGLVDGVLAAAPLPEYLAFSRGRVVWDAATDPAVPDIPSGSLLVSSTLAPDVRTEMVRIVRNGTRVLESSAPEEIVELVTDDYPLWEPDELFVAVRAAQEVLNPDGHLSQQALLQTATMIGVPLTAEAATARGAAADPGVAP